MYSGGHFAMDSLYAARLSEYLRHGVFWVRAQVQVVGGSVQLSQGKPKKPIDVGKDTPVGGKPDNPSGILALKDVFDAWHRPDWAFQLVSPT